MYDFSVENEYKKICHADSKKIFKEVMDCYFNENYRSSSVMLWTVVVCDLLYKLRELKDIYNDKAAGEILEEISTLQKSNPTDPKWETVLINRIGERTSFFDSYEVEFLIRIQKDRHLSAHPVVDRNYVLYSPTKEKVVANIREALEIVLTRPPILSKKIIDEIISDLADRKDILIEYEGVKRYLETKYLKNINSTVSCDIFKTLWKFVFKMNNEDCNENREINYKALLIVFGKYKQPIENYITSNTDYFSVTFDEKVDSAFYFMIIFFGKYPGVYNSLNSAAKEVISSLVNDNIKLTIAATFLRDDIKAHMENVISKLQANNRCMSSHSVSTEIIEEIKSRCFDCSEKQLFYNFCIKIYGSSIDFDSADALFEIIIKPNIEYFEENQINLLLEEIEKNEQTYWRSRSRADHQLVIDRASCVIGNFDSSNYNFL